MSSNYHTPYTTATLFKDTDMNPPLASLDAAITSSKAITCCGGSLAWDSTAGTLSWALDVHIASIGSDGKMFANILEVGAITIPINGIAYVPLSTVNNATVSATYVTFSTASTALIPNNRFILGVNNTANQFYPDQLSLHIDSILNDVQHESSITCASTFEVSFATVETRYLSLTTNASCIISNGVNGHKYRLRVTQDTTGSWTLDIGATAGSIKWKGGAAPVISTGATASDILTFIRSNGTWFGEADQGY